MRSEGERRRLEIHALSQASGRYIHRFTLGAGIGETEPAAAKEPAAFMQADKTVQRMVIGVRRINRFP